jgi:hypothetical protein
MPWESVSSQALAALPPCVSATSTHALLQLRSAIERLSSVANRLTFWNTRMDSALPSDEFSPQSAAAATASNKKPPP